VASSNLTNQQMNAILNLVLGTSAITQFNGAAHIKLTVGTAPSPALPGTELSGLEYVAGGSAITFSHANNEAATGPATTLEWLNNSGSQWLIVGFEIWDNAGTGVRWAWGVFGGAPIPVPSGQVFQIPANGISVQWT
jgi:hypothetical protein